jgi:hypothetical protein
MTSHRVAVTLAIVSALVGGVQSVRAAPDYSGQVTFAGLPVPGVTITASSGERRLVTVTDEQGLFKLADAGEGVWTIRVEMLAFETITRDVTIEDGSPPSSWTLTLKSFDEVTRRVTPVPSAQTGAEPSPPGPPQSSGRSVPSRAATPPAAGGGFQRAGVTASPTPPAAEEPTAGAAGAADGFLINGSVNNGAASPFALPAAFGNNRRRPGSLFNIGLGFVGDTSAWDSRPFSFGGRPPSKLTYDDEHLIGTFAGPLRFAHVLRKGPTVFLGYQHAVDHNASTQSAIVPTALERQGDFSQSLNAQGQPVRPIDPSTGQPFAGSMIPGDRISPQALALLGYVPQPNLTAGEGFNYQAPILAATHQDNLNTRVTQPINARNQLVGTFAYQRHVTDTTSLFGFQDSADVSGVDTAINWTHRFTQFFSLRTRYQFTQLTTSATPYFANRTNVSGEAGLAGNDQDPADWGPPSLIFSSGLAGLSDAAPAFTRNRTDGGGAEGYWGHGRHNLTLGGDVRRNQVDILAPQNPRGTFAFTGAATGSDLADFLLGVPSTSSIAFGNADTALRARWYDAYVTDDLRLTPTFTAQVGARWEYEAPPTELDGRLVNLDIAPGFQAISPVLAGNPVGSLTGRHYPDTLLQPDRRGVQPRLGVAWRPIPGSSLIIRGGYGIYRNVSVYQSIATLLAQQPPVSKTFTIANSAVQPLTLANGFTVPAGATPNTFAVDPDFRVGYAHNWQLLAQRDLPGSLTLTATYLGTKGSHLMQESLPNTYPVGAANPCPACPAGFVYLTSNGTSLRNAGQLQLRRRLRSGLAATLQYTLSKADDNATAFGGASLSGSSIAQNWLDLDAERGPSSFDQRHLVTAQIQYTTGMGLAGGGLLDGLKGTLFKGWTVTSALTAGSGLPLTPVYLAAVPGTGVTGTIRASLTGASVSAIPSGYYLNPAAYTAPAAGQWGDAGRNAIEGPGQFSLNAGIARTFAFGERLNLDWRIDATNVLNTVTYASVNTLVGSPQFGLPTLANPLRKIQSTLRFRF